MQINSMGRREFIVLMAAMSALDAFSIDAMMPALEQISTDLGILVENQRQYIITSLFFGFSIGVLAYGFISDSVGRRVPVLVGMVIYSIASLMCIYADTLNVLLTGRALQGVGAAGPYVIAIAIVRDRFEGRDMAEIMSLIMMVFIGIPMIAPYLGQSIMLFTGWRSIFIALAIYGLIVMLWFSLRQEETLPVEKRVNLTLASFWSQIKEILSEKQTVYYTVCMSVISGAFIAYLSTAQQVFQNIYLLGTDFPLVVALLASFYGIACFTNSRMVQILGMAKLISLAQIGIVASSAAYALIISLAQTLPPLWIHIAYTGFVIFCFGFLFENIITLALEPMSHIAGSATSVITAISTLIAIALSTFIGAFLVDSTMPLVLGFLFLCAIGWVVCKLADDTRVKNISK
ncbi:multidrug effflux MFS transporter [Granulosicoccus sp.]|nr:multidrug effflux MFS transporter [Granulosicoccus sp.]MDB4222577.1 multidrug effflux MFS transporter [Granulosicoccus sp.]